MSRLEQVINDLLKSLNSSTSKVPSYHQMLFAFDEGKTTNIDGFSKSQVATLFPIEKFSPQFDELLSKGFSWINFHCAGIYKGNIIFTIELPSYTSQVPASDVSINLSGPAWKPESVIIANSTPRGFPEWDFEKFYVIVETG